MAGCHYPPQDDENGKRPPARTNAQRQKSYTDKQRRKGRRCAYWWMDKAVLEELRSRLGSYPGDDVHDRLNAMLRDMLDKMPEPGEAPQPRAPEQGLEPHL